MKAIEAVYENGQIKLCGPAPNSNSGPISVLVVFPEDAEEPWQRILEDPTPRAALDKYVEECLEEIRQGKTQPLDLNQL